MVNRPDLRSDAEWLEGLVCEARSRERDAIIAAVENMRDTLYHTRDWDEGYAAACDEVIERIKARSNS